MDSTVYVNLIPSLPCLLTVQDGDLVESNFPLPLAVLRDLHLSLADVLDITLNVDYSVLILYLNDSLDGDDAHAQENDDKHASNEENYQEWVELVNIEYPAPPVGRTLGLSGRWFGLIR